MSLDRSTAAQPNSGAQTVPTSKWKASPATTTLFSAQQHREQAAYFRQFPNPKAQWAAQLHETVAKLIERKDQENRARLAELVEVAGPPLVPGNR